MLIKLDIGLLSLSQKTKTKTIMKTYCVTFGQQYKNEPHPKVRYAHPDGWLAIEAENMNEARKKAFDHLGPAWSFIYLEDQLDKSYFPAGELHRI